VRAYSAYRPQFSGSSLSARGSISAMCRELTTLWVARLDDGAELKVTDPEEQQGDVEEEEAEGKERRDGVGCRRRGTSC